MAVLHGAHQRTTTERHILVRSLLHTISSVQGRTREGTKYTHLLAVVHKTDGGPNRKP